MVSFQLSGKHKIFGISSIIILYILEITSSAFKFMVI